jgi:hypothetical protein
LIKSAQERPNFEITCESQAQLLEVALSLIKRRGFMTFSPMNFDQMNEADIRAEVIDPLLRLLGYRSGTELNIERERMLRYPRMSLGRKKPTDPEIRGRPDYILETRGVDRWIIEAKPPNQEISQEISTRHLAIRFSPKSQLHISFSAMADEFKFIKRLTDRAPFRSLICPMSASRRKFRY